MALPKSSPAGTAGRYLLVAVTEAADERDYIITARDMTDTEQRTFDEKGH